MHPPFPLRTAYSDSGAEENEGRKGRGDGGGGVVDNTPIFEGGLGVQEREEGSSSC